jgi:uncharacterized membrane protein YebE (DUF533 family)
MFDAKKILNQFLAGQSGAPGGGMAGGGNLGGIAGGALAGGLMGLLTGTKTGRKIGKNALTYGGTALLGGLAYKAWNDWQNGKAVTPGSGSPGTGAPVFEPAPAGSAFLPPADQENAFNRGLLRAMIGAAKADGHIDAREQQRIFKHVNELSLDAEEKAFVMDELASPLDANAVAAAATSPETAVEIYAVSLIAIDPSGSAEQKYLSQLASRLNLEPELVAHIHANVDQATA